MKKIERKTLWKMLVVVILIANSFYWCVKKEGYYIDELWSYGLSNSYYAPFLHQEDGYMHNWHQSMFYEDYLMVRQGELFSYDSVYYNQMQDVHPPFYYMILHTICSMFPNRFSKWFGLGINLLFFGGSTFLLYKISEMILGKGSSGSLIPPLLYGLSRGAVSNLIYIRMYMMLTFWALLLVFLTLVLIRTNESSKSRKLLAGIGVTMTAGFLTQYYFIVFASLWGGIQFGGFLSVNGVRRRNIVLRSALVL